MADKETIGISALVSTGIVLLAMLTPGFFDAPKFYCEAESSIMECPGGLSGGKHTRCYLNEEKNSWDYCRGGWVEVTDDRPIREKDEEIDPEETKTIVADSPDICCPVCAEEKKDCCYEKTGESC